MALVKVQYNIATTNPLGSAIVWRQALHLHSLYAGVMGPLWDHSGGIKMMDLWDVFCVEGWASFCCGTVSLVALLQVVLLNCGFPGAELGTGQALLPTKARQRESSTYK